MFFKRNKTTNASLSNPGAQQPIQLVRTRSSSMDNDLRAASRSDIRLVVFANFGDAFQQAGHAGRQGGSLGSTDTT